MPRLSLRRGPFLLFFAALALLIYLFQGINRPPGFSPAGIATPPRTVLRVIDGDTLLLDNNERVRLIGVDTPESVHPNKPVQAFAKDAAAFTRRLAEGRRVRLEFDQERTDRYGRTLAYVYLDDGTFLNAEIIRQGYGHAYTRFPFRHLEEFRALERDARQSRRGLWSSE